MINDDAAGEGNQTLVKSKTVAWACSPWSTIFAESISLSGPSPTMSR